MKNPFPLLAAALLTGTLSTAVLAAEGTPGHLPPKQAHFSFEGVFGQFDRAQLQRGYQVYKEVCSSCHSMSLLSFRNLEGLGLTPEQVKAVAEKYEVEDLNDIGETISRKAKASDPFPKPFPNEKAARAANNNALPPDLSLMAKARPDGANYIYSLMSGYRNPPAGHKTPEGLHYNPYFSTTELAMAQPLQPEQVTYIDGTPATIDQMSRDVATFLMWAAEPKLEERKRLGTGVMIFLAGLIAVTYLSYRRIWRDVKKS